MKKELFNLNNEAEKCASEIIDFLINKGMWVDTFVYANGKRWGCYDADPTHKYEHNWERYHYDNNWDCVFVEENINPKDYFEYTGNFLCLSTEGDFYDILNFYFPMSYCDIILEGFNAILEKYNKYYELGNAWNLALYDR